MAYIQYLREVKMPISNSVTITCNHYLKKFFPRLHFSPLYLHHHLTVILFFLVHNIKPGFQFPDIKPMRNQPLRMERSGSQPVNDIIPVIIVLMPERRIPCAIYRQLLSEYPPVDIPFQGHPPIMRIPHQHDFPRW